MLHIKNLSVSVDKKLILKNLNLSIKKGSITAIMGPNGSGKSTLAYALAGHPSYEIINGTLVLNNENINNLSPDKRAQHGLFLAFQQPYAIPGLKINTFLKEAHYATSGKQLSVHEFNEILTTRVKQLEIDSSFINRPINEGFSGGEKKKFEILQMLIVQPRMVILDEIDSGLDIDALKIVARGIAVAREENPDLSILIITHYQRILQYIKPNTVHILINGKLVKSGDATLADQLEQKGYDEFRKKK